MKDVAFFICLAFVAALAFMLGGAMDARRRRMRFDFCDLRNEMPDAEFQLLVSAIYPVPLEFVRAFRMAVARALGVEALKLHPQDRFGRDLRVLNYDGVELVGILERAFDVRLRVMDLVRVKTLRGLCRLVHERTQEISDLDPPLHRDPSPKVRPGEETAPEIGQ
ncbi:MAG: acyl carrier protein [Planctomycetes bacterium]|nr:acyl carrier protein [Planctomycetota bacterium]